MKHSSTSSFWCLVTSLLASLLALTTLAHGQTATQSIVLSPGWNAVWLEVEPVDANGKTKAPEDVFTNPAIQSVATPKPLAGLSEFFAIDPGTITTFNQDEWQQWKRSDPAGINNLSLIYGNRPYLIQVAPGSPVALPLTGKVSFFRPVWTPDRYNLVGFGLQGTPTFDAFFGPSGTKHPVSKIFSLNAASGNWEHVSGSSQMTSGQAYWVFSSGQSDYMGPVSVDFDLARSGSMDFAGPSDAVAVGTGVDALELDLKELVFTNVSSSPNTPQLDLITPDSASGKLDLFVVNPAANALGYVRGNQVDSTAGAGASSSLDTTVASNQTAILTLGSKRSWSDTLPRTNVYRLSTGANAASFWLPISANRSEFILPSSGTPANEVAGLWVGEVSFNTATSIVEDGAPVRPAAGSVSMRIIIHSDANGNVRLLSQVTVMQTKTASTDVRSAPVLVVDPAKIPFFEGIKERAGKRVGLRIEAVAYDMPRKLDGVSQAALIEDPNFLKLTTLSPALQTALATDPLIRTQTQKDLINSSASAIAAAKLTIPSLLPNYLLSSTGRPPKLVEAYDLSSPMSGSVGAGQTVTGNLILDPFHRSNPGRHAYHHDLAKGPQIARTFSVTFDVNQAVAGRLHGTCTETINGLIKTNLTLTGPVEFNRVSTVDSLN